MVICGTKLKRRQKDTGKETIWVPSVLNQDQICSTLAYFLAKLAHICLQKHISSLVDYGDKKETQTHTHIQKGVDAHHHLLIRLCLLLLQLAFGVCYYQL